ncbi:MAG: hypothetical protein AB4352_01520 [Hormoscilla sp.]
MSVVSYQLSFVSCQRHGTGDSAWYLLADNWSLAIGQMIIEQRTVTRAGDKYLYLANNATID